jgi:hypothetical protein
MTERDIHHNCPHWIISEVSWSWSFYLGAASAICCSQEALAIHHLLLIWSVERLVDRGREVQHRAAVHVHLSDGSALFIIPETKELVILEGWLLLLSRARVGLSLELLFLIIILLMLVEIHKKAKRLGHTFNA